MNTLFYPSICSTLLMLACNSRPSPLDTYYDNPAHNQSQQRIPISSWQLDASEPPAQTAPLPDNLAELARIAISRHPRVTVAVQQMQAAAAKVRTSRAWQDPRVRLTVGEIAETASGQLLAQIGTEQPLPVTGELDAQERIALADWKSSRLELHTVAQDVAAKVRQQYWHLLRATEGQKLIQDHILILNQLKDHVEARLRTGQGIKADFWSIEQMIASEQGRLETLQSQERIAQLHLSELLQVKTSQLPSFSWPDDTQLAPEARWVSEAQTGNPMLALARQQVQIRQAQQARTQLNKRPQWFVGAQYGIVENNGLSPVANGDDSWALTIGARIPLWSQKTDNERIAALRQTQAALTNVRATQSQLVLVARDTWQRARSEQQLIAIARDQMIPQAEAAFKMRLAAYPAGESTAAEVINDWRSWLNVRWIELEARTRLMLVIEEWHALAGTDIRTKNTQGEIQ